MANFKELYERFDDSDFNLLLNSDSVLQNVNKFGAPYSNDFLSALRVFRRIVNNFVRVYKSNYNNNLNDLSFILSDDELNNFYNNLGYVKDQLKSISISQDAYSIQNILQQFFAYLKSLSIYAIYARQLGLFAADFKTSTKELEKSLQAEVTKFNEINNTIAKLSPKLIKFQEKFNEINDTALKHASLKNTLAELDRQKDVLSNTIQDKEQSIKDITETTTRAIDNTNTINTQAQELLDVIKKESVESNNLVIQSKKLINEADDVLKKAFGAAVSDKFSADAESYYHWKRIWIIIATVLLIITMSLTFLYINDNNINFNWKIWEVDRKILIESIAWKVTLFIPLSALILFAGTQYRYYSRLLEEYRFRKIASAQLPSFIDMLNSSKNSEAARNLLAIVGEKSIFRNPLNSMFNKKSQTDEVNTLSVFNSLMNHWNNDNKKANS